MPDLIRVKEIFAHALALHGEDRKACLDEICAGDEALRAEVEAYLLAGENTGAFLGKTSHPSDPHLPLLERCGSMIGRYKLLEQIGEGGFGVVFMAEQEQPVRRRIALKIIKLGMDTRQVVARFEAERQALAIMDHPNIAKVFDAGSTDTGRPYFVMELVKGVPITEYCDRGRLNITQRLELFVQVCQAVQHAHQKGLIHRDLKPSNILVSTQDDRPVAKVIDFGIAKATQARLTEKTLFTEFRQLVGTPEYMSPEQADGSLDIDTRSDVYSLGVLLYQLLTGTAPFDAKELRSNAYDEMKRIIREVEPPPPSTRLSTLGDVGSIAACRGIEPKGLAALVRGELDWIVMKALEKDRARRYESAASLAADVMRQLADEPVAASPPSTTYRLRKLRRRHRTALRVAAAFLLLLVSATVFSSLQAVREARAKADALAQAKRADKQTAIAEGVNRFLSEEVFGLADPKHFTRAGITLVEALDIAAGKIDERFPNDPELRAVIRDRFGEIYNEIDKPQKAVIQLQKAVELRQSLFGKRDARTMSSRSNLGIALEMANRWTEAREVLESTLADQSVVLGAGHSDAVHTASRLALLLMEIRGYAADAPQDTADLQVARDGYRHAVETLGPRHEATLEMQDTLAWVLRWHQKYDEALVHAKSATMALRETKGSDDVQSMYATYNYAADLEEVGRNDEALAELQPLLKSRYRILGITHIDSMTTAWRVAGVLAGKNRHEEAIAVLDEVLSHLDEIQAEMSVRRGHELCSIADVYIGLQRYDRARTLHSVACKMYLGATDEEIRQHMDSLYELARTLCTSEHSELRQGGRAVELAMKVCALSEYNVPRFILVLASADMETNNIAAAQVCFQRVLQLQPDNLQVTYYLSLVQLATGDLPGYRVRCAAIAQQLNATTDPRNFHWLTSMCGYCPEALEDLSVPLKYSRDFVAQLPGSPQCRSDLGALLYRAGQFEEADKVFEQWIDVFNKARDDSSGSLPRFFRAMANWQLGRHDQARRLLAEADVSANEELKGGSNWRQRIVLEHIRREAEALLQIENPTHDAAIDSSATRP